MRVRDRVCVGTLRAARIGAALLAASAALVTNAAVREARADESPPACSCPCATAAAVHCPPAAALDGASDRSGKDKDNGVNTVSDDDVITPRPIGDSRVPLLPTTRGEIRELEAALDQQRWGVALDTVGVLTCALGTAFFIPLDNNHRVGDFSASATMGVILLGAGVTTIILGAVTYHRGAQREAEVAARVADRLILRTR